MMRNRFVIAVLGLASLVGAETDVSNLRLNNKAAAKTIGSTYSNWSGALSHLNPDAVKQTLKGVVAPSYRFVSKRDTGASTEMTLGEYIAQARQMCGVFARTKKWSCAVSGVSAPKAGAYISVAQWDYLFEIQTGGRPATMRLKYTTTDTWSLHGTSVKLIHTRVSNESSKFGG